MEQVIGLFRAVRSGMRGWQYPRHLKDRAWYRYSPLYRIRCASQKFLFSMFFEGNARMFPGIFGLHCRMGVICFRNISGCIA